MPPHAMARPPQAARTIPFQAARTGPAIPFPPAPPFFDFLRVLHHTWYLAYVTTRLLIRTTYRSPGKKQVYYTDFGFRARR